MLPSLYQLEKAGQIHPDTRILGVGRADWDKDAAWWCLTDAAGEMTSVGVADIELHDGDSYAFTYTK